MYKRQLNYSFVTPYISFVVTSRNDNHGEGMKKRMLLFMNGLIHQCRKHNLPAELIMVEWNPPGDTPLLHEVLPKPEKDDPLRIRYIIVPEEIHAQYKRGKEIPLFQMTAKNVGIQRAKGKFICCTNVDLLFPDEMFEILAKQDLDPQNYYRANRCDVPDQIELDWDFEKQIDF